MMPREGAVDAALEYWVDEVLSKPYIHEHHFEETDIRSNKRKIGWGSDRNIGAVSKHQGTRKLNKKSARRKK